MYDIFYIGELDSQYQKLKGSFPQIKQANSREEARKKAFTKFVWVVDAHTVVQDGFDFSFQASEYDRTLDHHFLNTNGSLGIGLLAKRPTGEKILDTVGSSVNGPLLDVVYISNGEPSAEANWERLNLSMSGYGNNIHRIDGVNGRTAAYQAAAQASTTHAFLAVFAKLEVSMEFNWSWTCNPLDRCHYVFHATNPVNGLVYGHQALIAYDKELVLSNPGDQIDFTMAQRYQEVGIDSGVAVYNTSAKGAWRTAFRETLKLKLYSETRGDNVAKARLVRWLSIGAAPYADSSAAGAHDAIEFYDQVEGNPLQLQKSFEWAWLDERYASKYS